MTTDAPGHPEPVRIVDVAREAGVSAQTVSNVVNERSGFSETTRRRVLAAIEKTGYRPNRAARSLRTRRSSQLGIHLPASHLSVQNPFSITFLSAVVSAAEEAGLQVVIFTYPIGDVTPAGVAASGVDGFILYNIGADDSRPPAILQAGIPFAVFGRLDPTLPQAWVDVDNAAAMATVVEHLVEQGRTRFAYVGYDEPEYWNRERLAGTLEQLGRHGLTIPDPLRLATNLRTAASAVDLMLTGTERPDAVVCSSDSLAAIVHACAARAGLAIGQDIAITGFDALPQRLDLVPSLTSVEIPVSEAAKRVVDMVVRQIAGDPAPGHGRILPTRLVIGGSG